MSLGFKFSDFYALCLDLFPKFENQGRFSLKRFYKSL